MRALMVALLAFLFSSWGCSTTSSPLPGVVEPRPGEVLTSIPGPMPSFGSFATVDEALFAACPFIIRQPHAAIPVHPRAQSFETYWRISREYCAWLYAPQGRDVEMSLLAVSAAQDDPKKRQCRLPAYVDDPRHPGDSISYLVILHSHPFDDQLSKNDLLFLVQMAQLHGFTPTVNGQEVSISIVAFLGEKRDGKISCKGFYQYLPARNSELIKVMVDASGQWRRTLMGHIRWHSDEDFTIERRQ
jgi:hypothetical protein